ncbi:MAG: DUF4340 domain-containing protein [Candidatus Latescibacteria bacterium]|nr:DUF4340 domain-containing protein [Candidatus Latescibacterota bacterium]
MGFRTTGILGLLFIGLLAFLYFYEIGGEEARRKAAEDAKKVFSIDEEQVKRVSVRRRDTTLVCVKDGDLWQIVEPIRTDGDRGSIESLIRSVKNLERTGAIADSEDVASGEVELADFGLKDPDATLALERSDGDADTLYLGDKSPTGSYAYLRRSGDPGILATNAWRKSGLEKGLFDLRDKRVLPFDRDDVRKIEVTGSGREVVLVRQEGEWHLEKPIQDRADEDAVKRLLSRLHTVRARGFSANEAADPSRYGLADPRLEVSLYEGEGLAKKTSVFGDPIRVGGKLRYHGKYLPKAPVFQVDSSLVGDVNKTPSDLRIKEIFAFDSTGVDRVTLAYSDSLVDCARDTVGDGWDVLHPPSVTLSSTMEDLIDDVNDLKAEGYVDGEAPHPADYGLDPPQVRVTIRRGSDVVREVAVGKVGEETYASVDGRTQIVEVKERILNRLKVRLTPMEPDAAADTTRAEIPGASGG